MGTFERYMFRNLAVATAFTAVVLASLIFLTQSLRFLELVISAGASSGAFWMLTFLALPRFFEIILPVSLMAATLFTYNRMIMDSELVVMRSTGSSPLALARPGLAFATLVAALLLLITTWVGPVSLAKMYEMRSVIKAQYSSLLFREGVFNAVVPGLTVFVKSRDRGGELHGIMIHDSRNKHENIPFTIIAKRGVMVSTDHGQQVIVFDGARHSYDPDKKILSRLAFDRYIVDMPEGTGEVRKRWIEPEERSFLRLISPDPNDERDVKSERAFMVEAHRRLISPFMAPMLAVVAMVSLLLGPMDRRGLGRRILVAVGLGIALQGLYLGIFNLSRHSDLGLVLMYVLVFAPLLGGLYLLSPQSEEFRRKYVFRGQTA